VDNDQEPIVTVVVLSYNFRGCLKECLDSVLEQDLDVPFEIIVADDASTDGSQELIRKYQNERPATVRPILRNKNVGANHNLAAALTKSQGQYIAYMDGDDLMKAGKLAKQVAFLDYYPECTVVAHQADRLLEGDTRTALPPREFPVKAELITFEPLLQYGNFIIHSSIMYRLSAIPRNGFPIYPWAMAYDFCRIMILAQTGMIGLIHETLGTYRVHAGGASKSGSQNIWRLYYGPRRAISVAKRTGCSDESYKAGLANIRLWVALRYLLQSDYVKFQKMIIMSRQARHLPDTYQGLLYRFRRLGPFINAARSIKRLCR